MVLRLGTPPSWKRCPGVLVLTHGPGTTSVSCVGRPSFAISRARLAATRLVMSPPLRILAMVVSPSDPNLDTLDVVEERRRIDEATRALQASGAVELVWLEGQTSRDRTRHCAARSGTCSTSRATAAMTLNVVERSS